MPQPKHNRLRSNVCFGPEEPESSATSSAKKSNPGQGDENKGTPLVHFVELVCLCAASTDLEILSRKEISVSAGMAYTARKDIAGKHFLLHSSCTYLVLSRAQCRLSWQIRRDVGRIEVDVQWKCYIHLALLEILYSEFLCGVGQ